MELPAGPGHQLAQHRRLSRRAWRGPRRASRRRGSRPMPDHGRDGVGVASHWAAGRGRRERDHRERARDVGNATHPQPLRNGGPIDPRLTGPNMLYRRATGHRMSRAPFPALSVLRRWRSPPRGRDASRRAAPSRTPSTSAAPGASSRSSPTSNTASPAATPVPTSSRKPRRASRASTRNAGRARSRPESWTTPTAAP
jgi:hypothetical protein